MGYTPEQNREYLRQRYREQMDGFIDRLGGQCVVCGTTEDLQIDHVDRRKKSFNVARLWARKDLPKVYRELKKCQLLCKPHHEEKTAREQSEDRTGTFTHGTLYGWQKAKCKCPECMVKRRADMDARNARRRTGSRGPYRTRRADT